MTVYVVALTGGIAAGKSSAQRCFQALGVHVYDADEAARAMVEPGSTSLRDIVRIFGADVLTADGKLDRAAMRQRVFADSSARVALESILHPRIRDWLRQRVDNDQGAYCVVSIPVLSENRAQYTWVNRILVVDTSNINQIKRLMRRDDIDRTLANSMIAAQASRQIRLALADDVIVNDGSEASLDEQVRVLDLMYRDLAANR